MQKPHRKVKIFGQVPVIFLKEGEMFVAYSPALDLSTCGSSFDEARKNFAEALGIFVEECTKRDTLEQALASYGWQKSDAHPPSWQPPLVVGQETLPVNLPTPA